MIQKQSNNVDSTFIVNNMKCSKKLKSKYMSKVIYMCEPEILVSQLSIPRTRFHFHWFLLNLEYVYIGKQKWILYSDILSEWSWMCNNTWELKSGTGVPWSPTEDRFFGYYYSFLGLFPYTFVWWNSKSSIKSFRKGRK